VIPDSVTSIGFGVFEYCTGLESITISDSVVEIGRGVFEACIRLNTVNFEGTLGQWQTLYYWSYQNGYYGDYQNGKYVIVCSNGTITK
jgi:hypothetical protein